MTNMAAIKEPPIIKDPQLFSYLQEMARQINYALAQNEVEIKKVIRRTVTDMQQDPSTEFFKQKAAEAQKLRGLIEQTAKEIISYVDKKEETYEGKYLAKSEFGAVLDERTLSVTTDPTGTTERYDYSSLIEALQKADTALKSYEVKSSKYIKRGELFTDELGFPIVGIAVGVIDESAAVTDSEGYYELSRSDYSATFTPKELAFWNHETKLAYFSDTALNVSNANITNELRIGNWLFKPDAGNGDLTISYQAG